ncbi:MAG: DUF885 family protein [Gammaproteobacteria bacterium]
MRNLILALFIGAFATGCANISQPRPISDPVEASTALNTMFDEWFELQLERNPIMATAIGDLRYNDQIPNFFAEANRIEAREINQRYLERARGISRDALAGQDRLGWDIFVRDREMAVEAERFPGWMLAVNQFGNYGSFFAQLGSGRSIQPFREPKHYDDFLSRAARFPELTHTAIGNLRAGIAAGVVQPRAVVEKTIPQFAAHVVDDPEQSVYWGPIAAMPDTFTVEERERLTAAYRAMIMDTLVPAYEEMRAFLETEYLPAASDKVGMLHLPDGRAWYAFQVKGQTTTDLTPEEIHAFGLGEVARILGEMNAVREQVGFDGDLQAFFRYLQEDDQFYYDNEEDLLQGYRDLQDRINPLLPRLFDVFPRADYEVRAVEAFRAQSAAGASYMAPAPDGSRPGVFYVNTYNLRGQPKFGMETLSIHEASPGHHFQIAIQQEIEALPSFRRFGGYSAFSEGWALYAESLGRELGVFTDPYQWYGRLADEQLRAMRLVVDTGMHYYGWTREEAIDYMKANSSMAETDVIAEVERYIVWPGQALNYKVGERVIRELRNEATAALGDDFDVRAFHREVLTDGALPLQVLQRKIREWIVGANL